MKTFFAVIGVLTGVAGAILGIYYTVDAIENVGYTKGVVAEQKVSSQRAVKIQELETKLAAADKAAEAKANGKVADAERRTINYHIAFNTSAKALRMMCLQDKEKTCDDFHWRMKNQVVFQKDGVEILTRFYTYIRNAAGDVIDFDDNPALAKK